MKPLIPCPLCKFSVFHTDLTTQRCQKKFKITHKIQIEKFISGVRKGNSIILRWCNYLIDIQNELESFPKSPKIQDRNDFELFEFLWNKKIFRQLGEE